MEKVAVSKIVEFRRKSKDSQKTFVNNLQKSKAEKTGDGGDYWTTSVSAISSTYKSGKKNLIKNKIEELIGKHNVATAKISKNMYQRNIEILYNFEDFDFSIYKPKIEFTYISKPNDKSIIKIKGIPVQVRPQHVFTYKKKNVQKIGAIWFVSKLDGFKTNEIGIFTDALHRYLDLNYSEKFEINPDFCLALDVVNLQDVRYTQILNKEIIPLLDSTIESIKQLL